jgi:hypothetical protein
LDSPHPQARTLRLVSLAAGGALLTLALLYAIGVNLLLSTGALARLLSARPDKLRVEYAHARTSLPGRVHLEGLVLTGQDARFEWQLRLDAADADIALLSLLRRRFVVERVVATGVSFRARFRLEAKDATADRIARIPPIPGLDAVPLLDLEREAEEEQEKERKGEPFAIQLENVDARGVREVWIDSLRLAGDMSAAGGFQLGPDHRLEVTPSRLLVRDAVLAVGDDAILSALSGAADATLEPVDLESVKGVHVLRALTSHSGFAGKVGGIRFLRHFLKAEPKLDFEGGEGFFSGLLVLERGILKPGSRSHLDLDPAQVTVAGYRLDARTVLDLAAGEDDGGGWVRSDTGLSSFTLSAPERARPVIASPSLAISARVSGADLAEPPRDFTYACDAPSVAMDDLSWIGTTALPKDGPFHIDAGRASARIRARGSRKEASAEIALTSSATLRFDGAVATTAIDANVESHASFEAGTIDLAGTEVALSSLAVRGAPARADWWGKATLESALVHTSPPTFGAAITTSARDARPLLSFYSAMARTSPAVTTVLALVPDPLVESMTASLHGGLRIAASPGALELHRLDVRGAQTRIRGELTKRAGSGKTGGLLFVAGPTAIGVSFEGEKTGLVLLDAPGWFDGEVLPKSR